MTGASSEVKGMYFVAARQHLLDRHGAEALARAVAAMPALHQQALLDPLASAWYPEEALHDAFVAVFDQVCRRDEAAFLEMLEEATRVGMNRFFRVLVGITTPSFMLKRYPVLTKQLRRGSTRVEVEVRDGKASIRVAALPFADDKLYQIAFVAGLNVLFDVMIARRPRTRVHAVSSRGFVIDVDWRAT